MIGTACENVFVTDAVIYLCVLGLSILTLHQKQGNTDTCQKAIRVVPRFLARALLVVGNLVYRALFPFEWSFFTNPIFSRFILTPIYHFRPEVIALLLVPLCEEVLFRSLGVGILIGDRKSSCFVRLLNLVFGLWHIGTPHRYPLVEALDHVFIPTQWEDEYADNPWWNQFWPFRRRSLREKERKQKRFLKEQSTLSITTVSNVIGIVTFTTLCSTRLQTPS